jgi:hypothetical protein
MSLVIAGLDQMSIAASFVRTTRARIRSLDSASGQSAWAARRPDRPAGLERPEVARAARQVAALLLQPYSPWDDGALLDRDAQRLVSIECHTGV